MNASEADATTLPWPGEELVHRVTGQMDRKLFMESGRQSVADLEAMLGSIGRSLATYEDILDFGCGCSRILMWMKHLTPGSKLYGSDIDDRAIEWSQKHLPWAQFTVNGALPPLEYPDGKFDLVFATSVFTHIDENYQDQWLAELKRVTRPGGHIIASLHGEHAFDSFEQGLHQEGRFTPDLRHELGEKGIKYITDDVHQGSPFPDFYHSTFHAPWYVFERWGRTFLIQAYVPRRSVHYQDMVLLLHPTEDIRLNPIQVVRQAAETPPAQSPPLRPNSLVSAAARLARQLLSASTPQNPSEAEGFPLKLLIDKMGDRINRLENDLRQSIRSQEKRLDALEGKSADDPESP